MRFFSTILLTLIFTLILCSGCGKGKKTSVEETDQFNAAIIEFINEKSMDMKVVEFLSIEIHDDTASCEVKMQDAEGLYSIKPKWKFYFVKKDGDWQVASYKIL